MELLQSEIKNKQGVLSSPDKSRGESGRRRDLGTSPSQTGRLGADEENDSAEDRQSWKWQMKEQIKMETQQSVKEALKKQLETLQVSIENEKEGLLAMIEEQKRAIADKDSMIQMLQQQVQHDEHHEEV